MPIRLALYQRDNRPLDGLCAQLLSAGYDLFERYTEEAIRDLLDGDDIDALLIDAGAASVPTLLATLSAENETSRMPVLLITEDPSDLLNEVVIGEGVDDVIILPIPRDDLRSRVRNVARLAAMAAELKRRHETLADFDIRGEADQQDQATTDMMQMLLVGPMGDDQVALIDLLDEAAIFSYATTTNQAWHQLRQGHVDMVAITGKVSPSEVGQFCRRVRATSGLTDLPLLIFDEPTTSPMIETIARDETVDVLRLPLQPFALRKRLEVLTRQHRMKCQLRGMMAGGHQVTAIDNLTGLYGRGFVYQHLERSIQESRERAAPLSVAVCRIKGITQVNEMLGYAAGDRLIGQLGRALGNSCRAQDLVARIRGASFCIVLQDTPEFEAGLVCKRVAEILGEIVDRAEGRRLSHADLAFGMAELDAGETAEMLITRALRQPPPLTFRQAS